MYEIIISPVHCIARRGQVSYCLGTMKSRAIMRRTLTVDEAAAELGVSRSLAYAAVRSGQLPAVRVGRRLLISRAALDALLGGPPSPITEGRGDLTGRETEGRRPTAIVGAIPTPGA